MNSYKKFIIMKEAVVVMKPAWMCMLKAVVKSCYFIDIKSNTCNGIRIIEFYINAQVFIKPIKLFDYRIASLPRYCCCLATEAYC